MQKDYYTNKLLKNKIEKPGERQVVFEMAIRECLANEDGASLIKIATKYAKDSFNYGKTAAGKTKKSKSNRTTKSVSTDK